MKYNNIPLQIAEKSAEPPKSYTVAWQKLRDEQASLKKSVSKEMSPGLYIADAKAKL